MASLFGSLTARRVAKKRSWPSAVYGLGMNHYPGPIKAMVEGAVRGALLFPLLDLRDIVLRAFQILQNEGDLVF